MSGCPSNSDHHAAETQSPIDGGSPAYTTSRHHSNQGAIDRPPTSGTAQSSLSTENPPCSEHGSLERIPTEQDLPPPTALAERTTTTASAGGPVYSVFTKNQKRFIIFMASWAGFFSPVSGQIYFPALNPLATDLHVSSSLINLTLTSYMVWYPSVQHSRSILTADHSDISRTRSDVRGRFCRCCWKAACVCWSVMFWPSNRIFTNIPNVCFTVYILANIGLALQNSYAALFVLRCFQSTGSSATIAMCSAVVSDVATAAERGKYMGLTLAGSLLGPAIGPVIGGLLAEFLGWRSIFWFLMIMGSAFLVVFAIFFPETGNCSSSSLQDVPIAHCHEARNQVGNGSIPPKGWNISLMNYLAIRKARGLHPNDQLRPTDVQPEALVGKRKKARFPNPLRSLYVILDKENALLLFYNAFLFAAFYDVTAAMPSQLHEIFGYNEFQIGL